MKGVRTTNGTDVMTNREKAMQDIVRERESQPPFDDSENTQGLWAAYIANYASRWAMPYSFSPDRYGFRACMVKVAALALAAIEWWDDCHGPACSFDAQQAQKVSAPVAEN